MAIVALRTSLRFVRGILRRYQLSLGHGALAVVAGIAIHLGGETWNYACLYWGLVSAQACLIGFWVALAARLWQVRMAYGGVHLLGLIFCILAAGREPLTPFGYDPLQFTRDLPAFFLTAFLGGLLLRRRGWELLTSTSDGRLDMAAADRPLQFPLGDFIKWFTLLCILLGLSVSLSPPRSVLLDDWLWHNRLAHYTEFALAVCVPMGFLASLIFLGMLARPVSVPRLLSLAAIWCAATMLWLAVVLVGLNLLYNAYYLLPGPMRARRQVPSIFVSLDTIGYAFPFDPSWTALPCLLLAVVVVSFTARYAGWRMSRHTSAALAGSPVNVLDALAPSDSVSYHQSPAAPTTPPPA